MLKERGILLPGFWSKIPTEKCTFFAWSDVGHDGFDLTVRSHIEAGVPLGQAIKAVQIRRDEQHTSPSC